MCELNSRRSRSSVRDRRLRRRRHCHRHSRRRCRRRARPRSVSRAGARATPSNLMKPSRGASTSTRSSSRPQVVQTCLVRSRGEVRERDARWTCKVDGRNEQHRGSTIRHSTRFNCKHLCQGMQHHSRSSPTTGTRVDSSRENCMARAELKKIASRGFESSVCQ